MKLSVIMSTRCDPIGTVITMRSALEELRGLDGEVVICDNSDTAEDFAELQSMIHPEYIDEGRVVLLRNTPPCIFTAREAAVKVASGDLLIFVDSHMIFGRDSLRAFQRFAEENADRKLGILYGPLSYYSKHESVAYRTRCVKTFRPVFLAAESDVRVPFRGVPMACWRNTFWAIRGYGSLATHRLSWGGGDFLLGFKPLLLGYENWLVIGGTCIHIGPFRNDPYFVRTYESKKEGGTKRWLGTLVAAYVVGGDALLAKRCEQIEKRLKHEKYVDRDIASVCSMGMEERRWIVANSVYTYDDIVAIYDNGHLVAEWEDVVGTN